MGLINVNLLLLFNDRQQLSNLVVCGIIFCRIKTQLDQQWQCVCIIKYRYRAGSITFVLNKLYEVLV